MFNHYQLVTKMKVAIKNTLKHSAIIIFITLFIFIAIDFLFGKKISNYLEITNVENIYRISNKHYNHGFKNNYKTNKARWGSILYKFCSDNRGFKYNCIDKEENTYDYAFMGDSFTEGIGLEFEKTFVGLFKKNSKLKVVNLGVAAYSPWLYEKKIRYLLTNNIIDFKRLIVSVDIGDLEDDWSHFKANKTQISTQEINPKYKKYNNISKFIIKTKKYLKKNLVLSDYLIQQIWWAGVRNLFNNYTTMYIDYDNPTSSWGYKKQFKNKLKIDLMIENMQNLSNFLKKRNIPLIIMIFPHPANILYDSPNSNYKLVWENFCKTECLYFIDSFSELVKKKDESKFIIEKFYIDGDTHFNYEGNKYIYEKIKEVLK